VITSETSHAIRTPLNQILGYVDLVTEDARDAGATALLPDLFRIKTAALDLLGQIETVSSAEMPEPFEIPKDEEGLAFLDSFLPPEEPAEGRILVVDDDVRNRDVLARLLERKGYSVQQAENGEEALDMLRQAEGPFDLVLLDIVMPVMNGWETLQRLKADEFLRSTPVIMISGLGETDAVVRCLELGAEDFVQKPFVPTILKARVASTIGHKRARDRAAELHTKLQASYRELREFVASEPAAKSGL
jgi:sigma-B regulation protein RsbU (phosphoserine phosphatase)